MKDFYFYIPYNIIHLYADYNESKHMSHTQ